MKSNKNMEIQIKVLTKSLREDIGLKELRQCLREKNFNIDKILQATYFESEDKLIYGIIIDEDSRVYQYEYSIEKIEVAKRHFDLLEITNNGKEYSIWPEINVGLDMIRRKDFQSMEKL